MMWREMEVKMKNSIIKRIWKHKRLPKTYVTVVGLGPVNYEVSIQQPSKREKWKYMMTIPAGTMESLKICGANTLEKAINKAIQWMEKHPEGYIEK